ncbi:hypothetical protein SteCoe_7928 [Stentor coeruleus]|uniref:Uncharacterized protein n=1 Tax=Stentor coeruleus TaxID=5963 RepID=A0A1R2CLK7_9CILI|nr:hypothetical protein SteCoe_7928 [Stentor coeruleus]
MLETLTKNIEIQSFLENFPHHQWRKAIEAASIFGIRKMQSHKIPFTPSTIENILSSSSTNLKQTITTLKQELKELSTAIKRIERKTLSSTDVCKENDIELNADYKKGNKKCTERRISSTKCLKKVCLNIQRRPSTPSFNFFRKELHEPKVCPLNDVQRLIRYVNPYRESISKISETGRLSADFLKTRTILST